ncbi:MAG TPA: hypothetical protein PKY01_13835 [Candidatus Hydrogenedentes bacterium]|nr:hypothetical protein [Candidatus Hydrogenedentota bacterium]
MKKLSRRLIHEAKKKNAWFYGNQVLYDLCKRHGEHRDIGVVVARIWLIGRAYTAAIERRKNKGAEEDNDTVYIDVMAPRIIESPIDDWLAEARQATPNSKTGIATLVRVHRLTTDLFSDISGLQKRSLASKYIRFHIPKLAYIYDSPAASAMRLLSVRLPRVIPKYESEDRECRKFVQKCEFLRTECLTKYGERLSPRQIDNLLLHVREK